MRVLTIFLLFMTSIFAVQIKDVANTVGVRDNQLIGYGLVVGLNGSGDGTSSKIYTTIHLKPFARYEYQSRS